MTRTVHGTEVQRESSRRWTGSAIRLVLLAVMAAGITMPSPSAAQERAEASATSFHELPLRLSLGDRITVTDNAGRALQGSLVDLSPSALSVLADGVQYELQETDVASIRQRRPDSVKNGAWTGFFVGVAVAAASLNDTEAGHYPGIVLAVAGLYGGAGAGIGALLDLSRTGSHVVYKTRGSARSVSVAPLLSRDRQGVAVSLGF